MQRSVRVRATKGTAHTLRVLYPILLMTQDQHHIVHPEPSQMIEVTVEEGALADPQEALGVKASADFQSPHARSRFRKSPGVRIARP
jgi:hypothetical protein